MIADIFLKMADQKRITDEEKDELSRFANSVAKSDFAVSSWVSPPYSVDSPYFQTVNALKGRFEFVPTEGLVVLQTGGLNQSIPNNTETTVSLNGGSPPAEFFFKDPASNDILIPTTSNTMGVFGKVHWAVNGTGRRAIHINRYTDAGAFVMGDTFHNLSPSQDPDVLPFACGFHLPENTSIRRLRFTVIQTSGGSLTIPFFSATLLVVR